MASVNRKSSSSTDVARFQRKFNDYGFAEHMKKEQRYMLTPFDLSECVGPIDTPYPKPPLGPQPCFSLVEPSWSSSQRGKSLDTHKLRKALSGKRIPRRKTYLRNGKQELYGKQEKVASKSNADHMPKSNVTEQKEKRSRIPVSIVKTRASKSTNDLKQATKDKHAIKRHFSSPSLGRKMKPSKIPVRIDKTNNKSSTGKSNKEVVDGITITKTKERLQESSKSRDSQSPAESSCFSSAKTEKKPVLNSITNSEAIETMFSDVQPRGDNESSLLAINFENDSREEIEKELNDKVLRCKSKTKQNKHDGEETICLQSSEVPVNFEPDTCSNTGADTKGRKDSEKTLPQTEGKLHPPAVLGGNDLCNPTIRSYQSSILLLVCETECSSDSGAETDVKNDSQTISPQADNSNPSVYKSTLSKTSSSIKQKPAIETDSGIVLSRETRASNQSSLLVMSHDTDFSSDCTTDAELQRECHTEDGKIRNKMDSLQNSILSDESRMNEEFTQKECTENNEIKGGSAVFTHNQLNEDSSTEGSFSVQSFGTTLTEMSVSSEEEIHSPTDREFMRMAKLLDTTVTPPLNLMREIGITKKKRRRRKRTRQQLACTTLSDGFSQHATDRLVSCTLSSSDEEQEEMQHNVETDENDTELEKLAKDNILLRGKLERVKQTNATLRSKEQTLKHKIEDKVAENELLTSKSRRLRTQVKTLKRKLKKTGTESRQREKALRTVIENLHKKLAAADKHSCTLKYDLHESDNTAAQQRMVCLEKEQIMSEQRVKIEQLEKRLAAQRDEMLCVDKRIQRQNDELQKANDEIEKQKAELQVIDEETVNQLEKIQITLAVLEEREHSLKEYKELSDKRVASLQEQISNEESKFARIDEQLEIEQNKNITLQVQIIDLKNQLVESHELEQRTAKLNKDLEFWNQQLATKYQRFEEEMGITELQLRKSESELEKVIAARDVQYEHYEEQRLNSEKQITELQRLNTQLLYNLNVTKADEPKGDSEVIILQSELDLMKECAHLKELLKRIKSEYYCLVEKTDGEKEMMRNEIDRLIKEGLRKDKELDMMEFSLEELGKVKNIEIMSLKQALKRLEENCLALKEELKKREVETEIVTRTKTKRKWFEGR